MQSTEALTTTTVNAQAILAVAWDTPVQLAMIDELDNDARSSVQRLQVIKGPTDAPQSIIVKQIGSGNEDRAFDPAEVDSFVLQRFWNECAGLQFLEEVFTGAPPAPRLYGVDHTKGMMVMEDLGHGASLVEAVLGNEPAVATAGLLELMTTLGQIHAHTIGKVQDYMRIRQRLGPSQPYFSSAAEGTLPPARIAELCHTLIDRLGIPTVTGLDQDLATVTRFWAEPGPFLAYTHGDPVPGNECKVGHQRKLLDFEYSGFRHALTEGVYARIQFVTGFYVQRIPDVIALAMENAYRTELVKGCPEASEDRRFYQAITEACAYATISMWHWAMPGILDQDEQWGLSSCRQRVLRRLALLAETTTAFGHLEALGAMAHKLRDELCQRWPIEVHTMPYFPAFRAEQDATHSSKSDSLSPRK